MNKEHLEHRARVKAKKPSFLRQDAALKRLEKKWRRPRGLDSKRRLKKDGHQKRPTIGYSSPKSVRGLNPQGLKEIVIRTPQDLTLVTKEHIAIIGRTVGTKKKIAILNKAKEQKITIANVDADAFLKSVAEKQQAKKKTIKKEEPKEQKTETKKEETPKKEDKEKEEKKKVLENKKNLKQGY